MYTSSSENAHLVVDRGRIARHHLTGRFWHALLAAAPLDVLLVVATGVEWASDVETSNSTAARLTLMSNAGVAGGVSGSTASPLPASMLTEPSDAAYCGLLRLASVANLMLYFRQWELNAINHTILDRILKNVFLGSICAHWITCSFVYIARQAEVAGGAIVPISHLSTSQALEFYVRNGHGVNAQYMRGIYWALMTMSGVGFGDIVPLTMGETIFTCFAFVIGTSLFLYTVGSVTSLISSADAEHAHVKGRLIALKKWMARASLPAEMRLRMLENFNQQYISSMGMEDRAMLSELPRFLQHEVPRRHVPCCDSPATSYPTVLTAG